jgi:hypothetical protein
MEQLDDETGDLAVDIDHFRAKGTCITEAWLQTDFEVWM